MKENRTPKQIGNNLVLCEDGTIWRWSSGDYTLNSFSGWEKMPPIPTDEQYEIIKKDREERREKWMEKRIDVGFGKIQE